MSQIFDLGRARGHNSALNQLGCVSTKAMDMGPFSALSECSDWKYFHSKWVSNCPSTYFWGFIAPCSLYISIIMSLRETLL